MLLRSSSNASHRPFSHEDGTTVEWSTTQSMGNGRETNNGRSAVVYHQKKKKGTKKVSFGKEQIVEQIRVLPKKHRKYLAPMSQTRREHQKARDEYRQELRQAQFLRSIIRGWKLATVAATTKKERFPSNSDSLYSSSSSTASSSASDMDVDSPKNNVSPIAEYHQKIDTDTQAGDAVVVDDTVVHTVLDTVDEPPVIENIESPIAQTSQSDIPTSSWNISPIHNAIDEHGIDAGDTEDNGGDMGGHAGVDAGNQSGSDAVGGEGGDAGSDADDEEEEDDADDDEQEEEEEEDEDEDEENVGNKSQKINDNTPDSMRLTSTTTQKRKLPKQVPMLPKRAKKNVQSTASTAAARSVQQQQLHQVCSLQQLTRVPRFVGQ